MFKYTVSYEDFDGNQQSETLYFNLSKIELTRLEKSVPEGYSAKLDAVDTNDGGSIINAFADIILMAYGKKSEDGKRFIKNEELKHEFEQSIAYDTFLFKMVENPDLIEEFTKAVFPRDLLAQVQPQLLANS